MALIPSTQTGSLSGTQKGTHDLWKGHSNLDVVDVHRGDAFDMHDRSRGGNDVLIAGKNNPSNLLDGDAAEMYDFSRGGHDIIIGGNGSFFDQLDGDASSMYGHSMGGNDLIIAGKAGFSVMHGDAVFMYDHAVGGDDVLVSGSGVEQMYGDGQVIDPTVTTGSDAFVFAPGNNTDFVGDFRQTDHDKIVLVGFGFSGIGDPGLHIEVVFDTDTVITFGDPADNNSVTLLGFTDPLTASDIVFL